MIETEKDKQLKDAATILLFGVALICMAIALAIGIVWGLLFFGLFCVIVALIKGDGAK